VHRGKRAPSTTRARPRVGWDGAFAVTVSPDNRTRTRPRTTPRLGRLSPRTRNPRGAQAASGCAPRHPGRGRHPDCTTFGRGPLRRHVPAVSGDVKKHVACRRATARLSLRLARDTATATLTPRADSNCVEDQWAPSTTASRLELASGLALGWRSARTAKNVYVPASVGDSSRSYARQP